MEGTSNYKEYLGSNDSNEPTGNETFSTVMGILGR